ncbi:MAG: ABC transporter ATP-binding protein [Bacteroidia bacterium]|nr:ABC transporter ATP-binding protein [Bacteroidia bacterium]
MVRITELQFAYRGQKNPLFTGLNLDLEPGNIYGLLGRNGAGKTSLLKMVTGLLFPELGELQVLGHQPGKRHPAFLQEIYFVAEESSLPAISIASFQKQQAPFYPRFSEAAFVKYLDTFDLTASTPLQQLSYGQKKKAQLAFAMATNAKVLIFDEPTNGLDIPSKSQFRKLLAGSIDEDQIYLISTHQVRDLGNLMDPIVILDGGKILFHQSQEAIAQRICFELMQQAREPEGVLHAERVAGGFLVMTENELEQESIVDIEVLFNAVMESPARIQSLFTEKVPNHE